MLIEVAGFLRTSGCYGCAKRVLKYACFRCRLRQAGFLASYLGVRSQGILDHIWLHPCSLKQILGLKCERHAGYCEPAVLASYLGGRAHGILGLPSDYILTASGRFWA